MEIDTPKGAAKMEVVDGGEGTKTEGGESTEGKSTESAE